MGNFSKRLTCENMSNQLVRFQRYYGLSGRAFAKALGLSYSTFLSVVANAGSGNRGHKNSPHPATTAKLLNQTFLPAEIQEAVRWLHEFEKLLLDGTIAAAKSLPTWNPPAADAA